mgnify:CR=1 FL=1
MGHREWLRLMRYAKNHNEYHRLITCVKSYTKINKLTIEQFYKLYRFNDIKVWYQDDYVYNTLLNKLRK